jgi:hypothetical protein
VLSGVSATNDFNAVYMTSQSRTYFDNQGRTGVLGIDSDGEYRQGNNGSSYVSLYLVERQDDGTQKSSDQWS